MLPTPTYKTMVKLLEKPTGLKNGGKSTQDFQGIYGLSQVYQVYQVPTVCPPLKLGQLPKANGFPNI